MIKSVPHFHGSVPPVVTPFSNGAVDYRAYARLIEFQIKNGSSGVLVNGTSAEPSTLSLAERNKLVDTAIEVSHGRVPVFAHTGSQSFFETEALTRHAVAAGADAILIVTPYYIRAPQRGIVQYYLEMTKGFETPWLIYHIPVRAAVTVTLDTVKEIAEKSPNFVGMKHTANDLGFVTKVLQALGPEFRLFSGLEDLSFPMLAIGACGMMNAIGNIVPRWLADLCAAVERGDLAEARRLHDRMFELNEAVLLETNPTAVKYMMKRLDLLGDNEHRLPMVPATAEFAGHLDHILRRSELLS
ncbi:MAG: 4-hydroxy-tetrahydrodipicolinate synthase [Stellaceae bacterium]